MSNLTNAWVPETMLLPGHEPSPPVAVTRRTGPMVFLTSLGLLVIAACAVRGRHGDAANTTDTLYFLGLLLLIAPAAIRVIGSRAGDVERVALTLFSAGAFQLSRTVLYPTHFMEHDEFIHQTVLHDITSTHRLFTPNTLLPVTPYYPGLELTTSAVQELTGLSDHVAAEVVLVLARLLMTLAILGVVRALSGSLRLACAAELIYACNPQYVDFNAQFSYQTLALPLVIFVVYAVVTRRHTSHTRWWQALALPFAAMIAAIFTHHLTALLLVAALGSWGLLAAVFARRVPAQGRDARVLAGLTVVGAAVALGWAGRPGNTFYGYVGDIATSSYDNVVDLIRGTQTHALFANSAGVPTPVWERLVSVASILVIVVIAVPALRRSTRYLRAGLALATFLSLVALLYPLVPAGHLAAATAEVSDRSAGFIFLGVAFVVALGFPELLNPRSRRGWALRAGLAAVVFLGGAVIGAGPLTGRVPGPFLVSADERSVDASELAAARWLATHSPWGTRVYADRDAGLLASAIGGQTTVTHVASGIDVSRVLLAPTFTSADSELLREARISLVIVDRRDATSLPNETYYVESGEYNSEHGPVRVSQRAVDKLGTVPGVRAIFDDGPVVVYDVRAISGA